MPYHSDQTPATPGVAHHNIKLIAEAEREFSRMRSRSERIADGIAAFVGSVPFVALHLAAFAFWILVNTGRALSMRPFDPFPFVLLTLIVSAEGVLLSTFVLIKQNRMSQAADRRAHLNLQVDLLAEREITKLLQMQKLLCERLEVREPGSDSELQELSRETGIREIVEQLDRNLPG